MKRLLTVAVFALLACAGLATPTFAGSFGLFSCGRHCDKCAVCIRPYNAFTPVLCGDVTGYTSGGCGQGGCGQGGCGQGGCGQGAYGPIGCCYGNGNCGQGGYGCGQGGYGCGQGGYGGCGAGGCAMGGYGWGHQGGYDHRLGMMNLRGPNDTGYTGALGYNPPDGLGNGAFGNFGTGRLSVYGNPGCGGCASCNNNNWAANMGNSAPMTCGPQGCAPAYGYGMTFAAPTFQPDVTSSAAPLVTPSEVKPPLIQVPNKPKSNEPPQARSIDGYQAQPVSYLPAQQMMPYGYWQPAWGYYGYQAPNYPAWGYQGW
jgi:hypothetical protein